MKSEEWAEHYLRLSHSSFFILHSSFKNSHFLKNSLHSLKHTLALDEVEI